jgi:hypothetical protein
MFPRHVHVLGFALRTRYIAACCSVCTGVFITAPAFRALHEASRVPRPPHAALILGNWVGATEDGAPAFLRFNRWSFASLELDGERTRGPVTFAADEFRIGPLPLPLLRDGPATFVAVERWPTADAPDALVAGGIAFKRAWAIV